MNLVFAFHFAGFAADQTPDDSGWGQIGSALRAIGPIGTNLFIVLTGFLIAKSASARAWRYEDFLRARLLRIYVPYLAVFSMVLVMGAAVAPGHKPLSASILIRNLVLIPGLFPNQPILTVTWTLALIVCAYIALPPAVRIVRSLLPSPTDRVLLWVSIFLMGLSLTGRSSGNYLLRTPLFFLGCALFEMNQSPIAREVGSLGQLSRRFASWGTFALLLSSSLWLPLLAVTEELHVARILLVAWIAGYFAFFCVQAPTGMSSDATVARLAGFGKAGYSFYLIHGPVQKAVALFVFPLLSSRGESMHLIWLMFPICLAITGALSFTSYRWIETPLSRYIGNRPRLERRGPGIEQGIPASSPVGAGRLA